MGVLFSPQMKLQVVILTGLACATVALPRSERDVSPNLYPPGNMAAAMPGYRDMTAFMANMSHLMQNMNGFMNHMSQVFHHFDIPTLGLHMEMIEKDDKSVRYGCEDKESNTTELTWSVNKVSVDGMDGLSVISFGNGTSELVFDLSKATPKSDDVICCMEKDEKKAEDDAVVYSTGAACSIG